LLLLKLGVDNEAGKLGLEIDVTMSCEKESGFSIATESDQELAHRTASSYGRHLVMRCEASCRCALSVAIENL
jgi:hypothetical protein